MDASLCRGFLRLGGYESVLAKQTLCVRTFRGLDRQEYQRQKPDVRVRIKNVPQNELSSSYTLTHSQTTKFWTRPN